MNNKRGISLIILGITIIVMSILASAVMIGVRDFNVQANDVVFAQELKAILQATNEYYLNNGEYPTSQTYTRQQVIDMAISEDYKTELQNEMSLNKDISQEYYKVDLNLISTGGGIFASEEDPVYVINVDATDIYYPKGFEVEGVVYFSLSSKLINISKFESDSDYSSINTDINNITESIKINKSTEEWTNNLNVTITTTLLSNEQLYYTVGGTQKQITTEAPYVITMSKDTLTSEQMTNIQNDSKIYFTKMADDEIIAKSSIDISNLDLLAPKINETVTYIPYSDYNLVKFTTVEEDKSGVVASFFVENDATISAQEIVSTGTQGESTYIKIDKSITSVKLVVVDAAGNISEIVEIEIPIEYVKEEG